MLWSHLVRLKSMLKSEISREQLSVVSMEQAATNSEIPWMKDVPQFRIDVTKVVQRNALECTNDSTRLRDMGLDLVYLFRHAADGFGKILQAWTTMRRSNQIEFQASTDRTWKLHPRRVKKSASSATKIRGPSRLLLAPYWLNAFSKCTKDLIIVQWIHYKNKPYDEIST